MLLPIDANLKECHNAALERAKVVSLDRETAKTKIDGVWWREIAEFIAPPSDELDHHWRWRDLISIQQNQPGVRAACVQTMDAEVQAAILLRITGDSALEENAGAVFIDRLATAPRNRANLVRNPRFRGAGTALINYSIVLSHSLGYAGRVNLYVAGSEAFYRSLGFVPTSVVHEDGTLFELPTAAATQWIVQRGLTK
jgi:hypothetical protein